MKIRKLLHRSLELPIQKKSKSWAKKAARRPQRSAAGTSTVGATHALARHAAASAGARNSARNHRTRGYGCARGELATVAVQPHNQKPHHRYDRERTCTRGRRATMQCTRHAPRSSFHQAPMPRTSPVPKQPHPSHSHEAAGTAGTVALPARWHSRPCTRSGSAAR